MATNKKNAEKETKVEETKVEETKAPEGNQEQTLSLADVQAAIAKMMEEAQAKADAIVSEAEARVKAYATTDDEAEKKRAKAQAKAENVARGEELLRIKLFKDATTYKDDKFVACNGDSCLIKRGVYVDVKRKFVEILDNSEIQDCLTNEMIARMDGKSEKLADL